MSPKEVIRLLKTYVKPDSRRKHLLEIFKTNLKKEKTPTKALEQTIIDVYRELLKMSLAIGTSTSLFFTVQNLIKKLRIKGVKTIDDKLQALIARVAQTITQMIIGSKKTPVKKFTLKAPKSKVETTIGSLINSFIYAAGVIAVLGVYIRQDLEVLVRPYKIDKVKLHVIYANTIQDVKSTIITNSTLNKIKKTVFILLSVLIVEDFLRFIIGMVTMLVFKESVFTSLALSKPEIALAFPLLIIALELRIIYELTKELAEYEE